MVNYSFSDSKKYSIHMSSVHQQQEDKRFKCHRCPKSFDYHKTLLKHVESHDAPPKRHECKVCGEAFSNKFTLHYHKQKHGAALACTKCPRTFKSKKGLRYGGHVTISCSSMFIQLDV